jgi:hypothetical protein
MRYKIVCLSTFIFLFSSFIFDTHAQITRGAEENEIYISTDWYIDYNEDIHYAIFHSTDNGENVTLKYKNIEVPPLGEMRVGNVLGDATHGALYNYGWNELWVSFDFGESWDFVEVYAYSGFYTSGSIEGEMYKNGTDVAGTLYFSNNYGTTFIEKNYDIKFLLEVGIEIGELYGRSGSPGIGYSIKYSINFGLDFLTIPIDSTVAFWQVSGYNPAITRGADAGEIYLISWWPDYHYKIFHSVDTGFTWSEKFESDYIDVYFWRVFYTAGREPGSFYVMRSRICPAGDHVWLFIDYSNDYGETFTTYFHDLDSMITSINYFNTPELNLSNFPNPFSEKTTIEFKLPNNCKDPILSIRNIKGQIIRQYNISGKTHGN